MRQQKLKRDSAKREKFDNLSSYYNSHRREVMAYTLYFTRNEEDAYDALQETFCLALENINQRNTEIENPRAWLLRIARNVMLRKQERKRQEALLWQKKAENEPRQNHFSIQVLDKILADNITNHIRSEFTEIMQEIFVLRHYHEMNLTDIATVTELPITTVHRLLEKITDQVQERFSSASGE